MSSSSSFSLDHSGRSHNKMRSKGICVCVFCFLFWRWCATRILLVGSRSLPTKDSMLPRSLAIKRSWLKSPGNGFVFFFFCFLLQDLNCSSYLDYFWRATLNLETDWNHWDARIVNRAKLTVYFLLCGIKSWIVYYQKITFSFKKKYYFFLLLFF